MFGDKNKMKKDEVAYNVSQKTPVCERRVNLLVYSLSLHRHSYVGFILSFASSIHRFIMSVTYSPIALANFSIVNLVSIFRCSSSTANPVYVRHVTSLVLVCSLSSHQHILSLPFALFIHNKQGRLKACVVKIRHSPIIPTPIYVYSLQLSLYSYNKQLHYSSPITRTNLSFINLVSIFKCTSPSCNTVYGTFLVLFQVGCV
jgi:hypothetical protein